MNEHNSDIFSCSENLLLLFTIKHKIYWFKFIEHPIEFKDPWH